jgi:dTDP-4-amino-4,6-dideoxygalactose transaminase
MIQVPFLNLGCMHQQVRSEILATFEKIYDSNWFLLGDHLKQFELEFARFSQVQYCIGTSNGLDALRLALDILEIGSGDEVIVPANSFIASALAIIHSGARPVFAETDPHTYNIDPAYLETIISPRTKAIMPVHLYGQPCAMDAITAIAGRHGLYIVEDNAQAQGARFNEQLTGSWGHINATSFYPGKNLGALGDAGAVTTNNEEYAEKARMLRNYGSREKYVHELSGYNMRMDECQAAFLSIKLRRLHQWIEQRRQLANWYTERLRGIEAIQLPVTHPQAYHVYHLYVIRTARRDRLQQHLQVNGISTLKHYPTPLHLEKIFARLGYEKGDLPVAEAHAATCLSLPLWPGMTETTIDKVCDVIQKFFA